MSGEVAVVGVEGVVGDDADEEVVGDEEDDAEVASCRGSSRGT